MVGISIISAVGTFCKLCGVLFKPSADAVNILRNIKFNVQQLSDETEYLAGKKDELIRVAKNIIDTDPNLKEKSKTLQIWSEQVTTLMEECEMVKKMHKERPSSWNCFRCGCCSNYELATKVDNLLKTKERLQDKTETFTAENMVVCVAPEDRYYPPFRFDYEVVGQEEVLERALDFIDNTSVVGIWGMGGVGKTTLLKCIYNNFCGKKRSFAVVILLTAGGDNTKNIAKMQTEIGKAIGLTGFSKDGDEGEQKRRIYDSLESRNFLLLVDDLWETINLENIGIPPLNNIASDKQQKMVIATREKNLCYLMGTKNFIVEMGLLDGNESWQLFYTKVADEMLLEDNEIRDLATDMVRKCDHLPLALHHVGKSMISRKKDCEWRKAKRELERLELMIRGGKHDSIVLNNMLENVLAILNLSFQKLKCDSKRKILFDLWQYDNTPVMQEAIAKSIALETIRGDCSHSSIDEDGDEDEALCSINDLVHSSLLLKNPMGLKIHACVYDMLAWLSCTDEQWYRWQHSPRHHTQEE